MMDTMTVEDRVLHYIGWHAIAYGAPAPTDEIVAQLHGKHGLTEAQASEVIESMRKAGRIAYREGVFTEGGWRAAHTAAH